jgi:hypothetical protein
MKILKFCIVLLVALTINGCGIYNLSGINNIDGKTFQVNYFQNNATLIEPGIERTFTLKLQDLIQNQTNLNLTNSNGDLVYEGEIVNYGTSPMASTAELNAAQTRLTITINVRFTNKNKEADNFEKRFSFYDDYDGNAQLTGPQLSKSLDLIFERITQDIFNDSLAKW